MKYVTVASESEATYLANLISGTFWIGVSDTALEGVFKNYNDGLYVGDFLPWVVNQPDNYQGKEDCVILVNYQFNDYNCENFMRVLCELEVPNVSATIVENLIEVEPPSNLFESIGKSCKKYSMFWILYFLNFLSQLYQ